MPLTYLSRCCGAVREFEHSLHLRNSRLVGLTCAPKLPPDLCRVHRAIARTIDGFRADLRVIRSDPLNPRHKAGIGSQSFDLNSLSVRHPNRFTEDCELCNPRLAGSIGAVMILVLAPSLAQAQPN